MGFINFFNDISNISFKFKKIDDYMISYHPLTDFFALKKQQLQQQYNHKENDHDNKIYGNTNNIFDEKKYKEKLLRLKQKQQKRQYETNKSNNKDNTDNDVAELKKMNNKDTNSSSSSSQHLS